jgi:hypothetical protein
VTPLWDYQRGLALTVYVATVADCVNQQYLLCVQYLIDDPIVTDSQLVQAGEAAVQGLRSDCAEIRCQPTNALDDATRFRPVKPRQVANRGIQQTRPERHG